MAQSWIILWSTMMICLDRVVGSAANDDVVVAIAIPYVFQSSRVGARIRLSRRRVLLFPVRLRLPSSPPICSRFRPQEAEALAHVCRGRLVSMLYLSRSFLPLQFLGQYSHLRIYR